MRRMEKVTGRSDDMMIIRGVNVFPTQIEELILRSEGLSPHFYIELSKTDRMDTMTVNVEALPGSAAEDVRIGMAAELQTLIKNNIGVTSIVHVVEPETIERSRGKAKRIVDNRPKK